MKPVLTFLSTVSILWGSVVSIEASKPNIVLILADDLGWGEISCQGGKVPTPHIDRLAGSGQRWTRFYTNSSVCSPTRASLLTGRYPQRAGITHALVQPIEGHEGLAPEEWTLAEALREDGYHTGLIGKWHLGSAPDRQPQAQGFDEFKGCLSGMIDHTSHADKMGEVDWWHGTDRNLEKGYVTHLIARHSVEFVRQNAEREKPFFLFVSFTTPHSPYTAPGAEPVWKLGQENRGDNVREPGAKEGRETLVREMDLAVGSVMQALRESGAVDNTLVVFLSDNGAPGQYNRAEFFVGDNGGLRGQKFDAWEGGIRVPAIFHWPGKIAPGAIHEPGITMDLMPTFLALACVEARPPKPFDGIDLTDSLLEGKEPFTRDLYWMIRPYAAVSSQGRKLVVTERLAGARAGEELFDLAQDEKETSDLSGREPERKASLRKKLETWQDEVRRPGRQRTNPRDYGAAGDGKKLDTHALQRAIDVCYRRGGGVVRVPPGTYRCGTVELRSDVTLHLEKGAVIKGSDDLKDYLQFEGTTERSGLLLALNVERIRIEGEGTIDGNSSAFALDEVKFAQEVKTAIPYTRQRDAYLCPPDPRVTTPLITKGVSFENITAKSETGNLLWGDPASPIRDVSFRNVKLTVAPGPLASAKGGNYDLRPMADDSRNFFQHDIHALHARHVSGLVVQGLDVAWKGAVPDFYGETVLIENSTEVELDAVHDGSPERKPGAPTVRTVDHLRP